MRLKRRIASWVVEALDRLDDLMAALRQHACSHRWRPARHDRQPARHCGRCGLTEVLEPEAFFAQFGERPWQL